MEMRMMGEKLVKGEKIDEELKREKEMEERGLRY